MTKTPVQFEDRNAQELARYLRELGCFDVAPHCLIICGTPYQAARYKQKFKPLAEARSQEEYIVNRYYVLGSLPVRYIRDSKICFRFTGDNRDWYITGYYPEIKNKKQSDILDPKYAEYNPFGHWFALAPWDVEGKVDEGEAKPYTRLPIDIDY